MDIVVNGSNVRLYISNYIKQRALILLNSYRMLRTTV